MPPRLQMQGAAGDGHGLATDAHRQFVAVSGPFDVDQAIASQLPLPEHDVVWRRVTYPVLSDEALAALLDALQQLGFPQGGA